MNKIALILKNIIISSLAAVLCACSGYSSMDEMEHAIERDTSVTYTFYFDEPSMGPLCITRKYPIGRDISPASFPKEEDIARITDAYKDKVLVGWKFFENPISGDQSPPPNIPVDDAGHVKKMRPSPQPAAFFAEWRDAVFYSVRILYEDGTEFETQSVRENIPAVKPESDPVKKACVFAGWYTDSACTKSFDWKTKINADTVIYIKMNLQTDFYVSAETGSDSPSDTEGTIGNPYRTLTHAVTSIKGISALSGQYVTVKLLSDIYENAVLPDLSGNVAQLVIEGSNHKIDGESSGSVVRLNGGSIQFQNVMITGGSAEYGGGIHVTNGSILHIAEGTEISGNYASQQGGALYIDSANVSMSGGQIHYNKSEAEGSAVYVNTGSRFSMEGGKIIENTACIYNGYAVHAGDAAYLLLENCLIESNYGGGVYIAAETCLGSGVTVAGNSPDSTLHNVFIPDGRKLKITSALTSGNIYVTTENPPSAGNDIVFTEGYGDAASKTPDTFFHSDYSYAVALSGGEAALSTSSGSMTDVFDYRIEFTLDTVTFKAGEESKIRITPKIMAKDISGNEILLNYDPDSNSTDDGNTVAWTVDLYAGFGFLQRLGTSNMVTIPSTLYADEYKLYITAEYLGVTYDGNITITGTE